MNDILVSIICNTYNHEAFIEDALKSFLMQETSFNFEILVHDDASTDKTADIVKSYAVKYPELIKAIYQTENQYSKKVKVGQINRARALGKYIAICEGDDYWTDPNKLQKQAEFMETHPECSVCFHAAHKVNALTKDIINDIRPSRENRYFNVEEIIEGGGGNFATNSLFYRTHIGMELPEFYFHSPVGDYPLMIYLSLVGSIFYFDEFMSMYRSHVKGSWTDRKFSDIEKKLKHFKQIANMLDEIDVYTDYRYTRTIQNKKRFNQWKLLLEQGKFNDARSGEYKALYSELKYKKRLRLYLKFYGPNILKFIHFVKNRLSFVKK